MEAVGWLDFRVRVSLMRSMVLRGRLVILAKRERAQCRERHHF